MGVHAVDGMIDLCGPIKEVYCQSFRRVVEIDADDTTSILFRMKEGMSGYLGTMTATGGGFSFHRITSYNVCYTKLLREMYCPPFSSLRSG